MELKKTIKKFFSSKFNIALVLFLLILGVVAFTLSSSPTQKNISNQTSEVHFFYLPTCPHCADQKPIYYEIKENRTDVAFYEHDASSKEGSQLFYQMATEAGLDTSNLGVPTIFVGKNPLVGFHTKEQIISAIEECLNECKGEEFASQGQQQVDTGFGDFELPLIGRTDLTKWSLPVLAIVLGLVDGFNPCAMWVLVYLISLLLGVNDKKKIWLIVGSFVFASGALYFLFMTAWINVFLWIGYINVLTILIGLVALGGGILNIKEYLTTKGNLTCKVEDEKSQEKTMKKIERIVSEPVSIAIIFSIIGLAFVVNSVEFMCSAAIPAVFTQVLALSGISTFQNYLYILIYVFFFMLDDLVIFGMAAFAVGSSLGEKYAKYCKIIGGILLVILGAIMLFAPQLLR
ncbi:MAG: hypothetical protein ACP5OG_04300 [Candidatus Nanoarchaeia archaeon]